MPAITEIVSSFVFNVPFSIRLILSRVRFASSASSSSSLTDTDTSLLSAADDDHFCSYTHDFVRLNMGVSALSKPQMGAIMTGRLKRVLQLYRQYRNAATGSTRDFYDYEILLMERALTVK